MEEYVVIFFFSHHEMALKYFSWTYEMFLFRLKILADAMGLGKTVMTISLLLTHKEIGGSLVKPDSEGLDTGNVLKQSSDLFKNVPKLSNLNMLRQKCTWTNGGSLIVCPMTLIGQWKVTTVIVSFIVMKTI